MVPVDDPISTIVGGPWGHMYVGGELACVSSTAECSKSQAIEPKRERSHRPNSIVVGNNGLVASATSGVFHGLFYHEVKAATKIHASSSFYTYSYWCGFFRWCQATAGSSSVSASFQAFRSTGSINNGSNRAQAFDVYEVAATNWAFGVAYGGWDDGSHMKPGIPDLGIVEATSGMCSNHSAGDNVGFVAPLTADGIHGSGC
jgi:hypothetical protein